MTDLLLAGSMAIILGAAVTLDIRVHRNDAVISLRDASIWSVLYVLLAMHAAWLLWQTKGAADAQLFLTGYVLEKSLSVDNLMVFAAIFTYFGVGASHQHGLLHWGIIGSVIMRLLFVALGAGSLLLVGPWMGLLFGVVVIWSAIKMLQGGGEDGVGDLLAVRLAQKFHVSQFMFLLIIVEISDILFAFDSVPAVIAIVQDPLLVYASIMYAVVGLRSMYFILSALQRYLVYLGPAVICVLFFVGLKLIVQSAADLTGATIVEITPIMNLSIVLGTLGLGVLASLLKRPTSD